MTWQELMVFGTVSGFVSGLAKEAALALGHLVERWKRPRRVWVPEEPAVAGAESVGASRAVRNIRLASLPGVDHPEACREVVALLGFGYEVREEGGGRWPSFRLVAPKVEVQ